MIRALLACCLLAAAGVAGEAAAAPHQGTVVLGERSYDNVWIMSETTDGLVHTLSEDRNAATSTNTPRGKYIRVDYARPNDVAFLRAEAQAKAANWEQAATQYAEATKSRESWWVREIAHIRGAEAWVLAKKPDQALQLLDAVAKLAPKSVHQARAGYLRGQALLLKGDGAGAAKAFGDLAGRKDLGAEGAALGALGQAEALAAGGKHDEAAKALAPVFDRLDAGRDAELFGKVGAALAASQQAAGQTDPAIATLKRMAYGAGDGSDRARAQLSWARLLAQSDDAARIFEAFDHAAIAMGAREADAATVQAATQLAGQLVGRIDKLPADKASNELKAEYRRYLSR